MYDYKICILFALSTCFFVYIHSEGVGSSCFYPNDCGLWHVVCENGVCKCDAEHIPDRENKWCAVDILKACGYHDECYDRNAECVGVAIPKYGSCQCKNGYTLHEKKMVCSAGISTSSFHMYTFHKKLIYPNDCGLWHVVCENGVCKCDAEHIPDRENKWCAVDILKACGYHDECYDRNAECVGVAIPKYGSCQCKNGYTLHEKKMVCSAVIGNNCSITDDCIEGTCKFATCGDKPCNYTQCFCNDRLQPNLNGTKCRPALHDDCSQYNECAREHAICKRLDEKKICECDELYKEASRGTNTYCLAKLGVTCLNTTDCADGNAICAGKNETTKLERPTCKKNIYGYWSEWPPKDPPKKYCVCTNGYVKHPEPDPAAELDVSECLKVATKEHDNCTHSIQCSTYSGFGSECKKGNCDCKENFYFDVDFERCVRSCLCDPSGVREIVDVLKDLAPTFEVLAKNMNMNVSGVLRKIKNLKN